MSPSKQNSFKKKRGRKTPKNKNKNQKETSAGTIISNLSLIGASDEDLWSALVALDDWDWPHDEVTCTKKDVLLGRGALTNNHEGNVRFRAYASQLRPDFWNVESLTMMKMDGARFLKKNANGMNYFVVEDDIVINKATQAKMLKCVEYGVKPGKRKGDQQSNRVEKIWFLLYWSVQTFTYTLLLYM